MKNLFTIFLLCLVLLPLQSQTFPHLTGFGQATLDDIDEACMTIAAGKLFVQDDDDEDVKVFSLSDYTNLISFGSANIDDSEDGIAVANNRIFVVDNDFGDAEIDVFDLTSPHNFEISFGNAQIGEPEGLTTFGGLLFVSDTGDDQIEIFSTTSPYNHQGSFGNPNLQRPRAIAVADGKFFVVDRGDNQVEVFSATSPYTHLGSFGSAQISRADDAIAIGENFIYVIDDDDNQIEVFERAAPYNHVTKFGGPELDEPECLAVSGDRVFVADDDDNQIEVYQIILPSAPIPAFSQWSLFIFFLLLLNLGIITAHRIKVIETNL